MKIFGREPVAWVGIIVAVILAVVQTLLGEGVISDALSGRITDIVQSLSGSVIVLIPIVTTLLARRGSTSAAQPKLEVGTAVLVDRPAGQPEDTPPPDAIVALRSDLKPAQLELREGDKPDA